MSAYTFHVPTIKCYGCASKLEQHLRKNLLSPISFLSIDPDEKTVEIEGDGLELPVVKSLIEQLHTVDNAEADQTKNSNYYLSRGIACALLGAPLLGLSIAAVPLTMPWMIGIAAASTLVCLVAGYDIYWQALKALFNTGSVTIDTLFMLSTLVALGVSIASFWVPMLHFEFAMALLIFACRNLGKYVESTLAKKVSSVRNFCMQLPQEARRVDEEISEAVANFKVGEVVRIRQGETIPFDGIVVGGSAEILKTIKNGDLLPASVEQKEILYAGMTVDQGYIDLKITKTQKNCYLRTLDTAVKKARKNQVPLEQTTNKIIQYFVPGVLALTAIAAGVVMPLWGINLGLHVALGILAGACPCALGYTVPLAVKAGVTRSAQLGAVIVNADVLEKANEVDTVIFDLNGTLTQGRPKVKEFKNFGMDSDAKELLGLIHVLENELKTHNLIGGAIREFTEEYKDYWGKQPIELQEEKDTPGFSACVNSDRYIIGSAGMMDKYKIPIDDRQAGSVYVAKNDKLVGIFSTQDSLRSDAKSTLDALHAQGKQLVICTGADEETAFDYARQLGISAENVYANVVGAFNKQKIIEENFKRKKVAFIGDAANDASAMAVSHVAVAVNNADKTIAENSGVTIAKDSLKPISHFFAVSNKVSAVITQNLGITFAYNLSAVFLCVGLATALGMAGPAVMALCMTVQSLIILANTARINYAGCIFTDAEEKIESKQGDLERLQTMKI